MRRATPLLAIVLVLVGCGARSGLLVEAEDADASGPTPCAQPPWIVFDHAQWPILDVYAMRADGSELRRLALPDGQALHPTVSADGRYLAYVPFADEAGSPVVVVLDLHTGRSQRVVLGSRITYPTFSPDASWIAYADGLDLRVARRDGSEARTLISGPLSIGAGRYGYGHPIFVDATTILWTTAGQSGVIQIDGSGRQTLLVSDFRLQPFPNPALSPDRTELAALNSCARTFTTELRVYALASLPADCATGRRIVDDLLPTSDRGLSPNPSWGPTDLIAFGQGADVFVVEATGGIPRNLTSSLTADGGAVGNPVWAPGCTALPRADP